MNVEKLLSALAKPKPWDTEPVFCFTADIDWASDAVLKIFYEQLESYGIFPHTFVTHKSKTVDTLIDENKIDAGIHPNFLQGSSHGNSFAEVIETCIKFVPQSWIYRSHRAFSVTDTSHLLKNKYGHKVSSNIVTIMQENIKPILHESGLIEFPIFFEDGTHLYNKLELDLKNYINRFTSPGIKIINFHPMNFIINPATIVYMRNIKDTLSRESYNSFSNEDILKHKNNNVGIKNLCVEIIQLSNKYKVAKLSELYDLAIN